jgi:hypothetical protein
MIKTKDERWWRKLRRMNAKQFPHVTPGGTENKKEKLNLH